FQIRQLALKPFAPPDELYIVAPNQKDPVSLNVIGQDGKTRRTVVWQVSRGAVQRVDAKGNIYVADMPKPADRSYPEFFDGKLAPPPPRAKEEICGGTATCTAASSNSRPAEASSGIRRRCRPVSSERPHRNCSRS